MLVKVIMAPFMLRAWCSACICITLFSGPGWSLDPLSALQEASCLGPRWLWAGRHVWGPWGRTLAGSC